jgi:CPA2 family monovalent cation:H+ antiporter-2
VLGKIGRDSGVISEDTHRLMVSVAIVSLFATPFLVPGAGPLGAWLAVRVGRSALAPGFGEAEEHPAPDVVIAGFGPAGEFAARAFTGRPERVLVIDLNQEGVRRAKELGFDAHVGDATQLDVLEHARVASVRAVVITVPYHDSAVTILQHVRRLAPAAHCVVRSRHQRHTGDLINAGAHVVFGDEEQIGLTLGGHLKDWLIAEVGEADCKPDATGS